MSEIHKAGNGAIFGVVSEEGVAKASSPVTLLDMNRASGVSSPKILSRQLTASDGGFVFNGLNPEYTDYAAFASDEDGALPKNALIQDRIQPIPAYQGATFWSNWRNLAMADDPVVMFDGQLDKGNLLTGLATGEAGRNAAGTVETVFSISNGAPNIPALALIGTAYAVVARPNPDAQGIPNPKRLSGEWVFDKSSVTGPRQFGVTLASASYATAGGGILQDSIYVTQTISIYYDQATDTLRGGGAATASTKPNPNTISASLAGITGAIHAALVVDYGVEAKLYINGALAATASLSGQAASYYAAGVTTFVGAVVGGDVATGSANLATNYLTMGTTGAFAFYSQKLLTAAEVQARYEALMTAVLPNATGYVKEVLLNKPLYFYRLNDTDATLPAVEFCTRNSTRLRATRYGAAQDQLLLPSPVVGGNMTRFTGTSVAYTKVMDTSSGNRQAFTMVLFCEFAGAGAAQTLVRSSQTDTTIYQLSRDANNKLALSFNAGAVTTVTFAPVIAADVTRHVAVRFDAKNTRVDLFLDGVLADTRAISAVTLVAQPQGKLYEANYNLSIGGFVTNATVLSQGFNGKLGEVAFFSDALSDARIAAIYAAKDTP